VNVFRVLTCHEEYCSAGVAEIMEADLGQVRSLQEGPEVAAERVGGTRGNGCDRREDEIVVLPQAERPTSFLYGLKPNTPERASASSTNDGRVVNFAGAIGVIGSTVDQKVAAFKIRGVLRRASGR
jgi:hypothetical protein